MSKRKLPESGDFEREQKRSRELSILEKNSKLTEYLDTLVPGSAPEQQLSFDVVQQLAKPGILDIDDDLDDNLTAHERYWIEKDANDLNLDADHESHLTNGQFFNKIKAIRAKNHIKLREVHSDDDIESDDDDKKPVEEDEFPVPMMSMPQVTFFWNPLAENAQERLDEFVNEDERRRLDSSEIFILLQHIQSHFEQQTFLMITHFRNMLNKYLTIEPHGSMQYNVNGKCIASYLARDDEFITSPCRQIRVVFYLESQDQTWRLRKSWLLPETIGIQII